MGGPLLNLDLSISLGATETYGPFGFADQETTDPFTQYQVLVYRNLTGYTASWIVRTENDNVSTAILSYTSGGGQITFSALAAAAGPPAPAFNNAVGWTVPHSTSTTLTVGVYYYTLWLIEPGGAWDPYMSGKYMVLGAQ